MSPFSQASRNRAASSSPSPGEGSNLGRRARSALLARWLIWRTFASLFPTIREISGYS